MGRENDIIGSGRNYGADDEHLVQVVSGSVRSIPGVGSTETLVYLRLEKENYQWGTR